MNKTELDDQTMNNIVGISYVIGIVAIVVGFFLLNVILGFVVLGIAMIVTSLLGTSVLEKREKERNRRY